jgi:diguanylate cyclase (GGDEF)-like protein
MMEFIEDARRRIRADFRLGIYLSFAAMGMVFILPLMMVRLWQGDIARAALDLFIGAVIVFAMVYAWRGGDLDRLGTGASLAISAGAAVAVSINPAGVFWAFPVVLANAFLVSPRLSFLVAMALVSFVAYRILGEEGVAQPLSVLGGLAANAAFATVFARSSGLRREQLEQLATLDPLTGIENRRALETELVIALAAFQRDARPVAMAMIDLDHFKKVNDVHGHDVGDRVLRDFARLTEGAVRRTDRLFRFGGEEFVLLMPGTDDLGLELAMSHLRLRLRENLRAGTEPVTVSIGGAILRRNESSEAWCARADAALYRAKANGRNRLEIDPEPR